jgi:hypothetical protein
MDAIIWLFGGQGQVIISCRPAVSATPDSTAGAVRMAARPSFWASNRGQRYERAWRMDLRPVTD